MGDQTKKGSNVTVEQMIEHMTADIQNSDGQYIPLGFTSPPANTDSHIWSEYAQNQLPQNHFMQHFGRTPEPVPYQIDPNSRFVSQNVAYNNFMAQNTIFVPEMQNNAFEKHLNMDMHGNKYVLYPGQTPQYVMTNQDMPLYMPVYPENRECPLFANQEMQMQQQNVLSQQNASNSGDQLYINDNVILQQTHQEALKNKLLMQQNMTPTPNRTHLIENLVGNWASNTNGTYSPFGNVQTQNSPTFFDLNQQEVTPQPPVNNPQQCAEGLQQLLTEQPDRATSDFSAKTLKSGVKKQKQVAEVKPMRPTYSDVLTKSVPLQSTPKQEKIDAKEAKIKNQIGKKTSKNDKFSKITLNRQISNNGIDTKVDNNGSKFTDKPPSDQKVNLSRKWVSLDDVNEVHSNNDFLKSNDLNVEATGSATKSKKTKKPDSTPTGASVKNENVTATNLNKSNLKKSFHVNSSLGCQWTENAENSENSKNEEKNINKNPNKKGKEARSNSARQNRFSERSGDKPPGSAKRNQRTRKKEINSTLGLFGRHVQHYMSRWSKVIFSCIMWLLHLISDIFSMSAHLGRDFGTVLWDSILIYSKSLSHNTMFLLKRVKFFTKIGAYVDKTFGNSRWAFWNRGAKERKNSKAESKTWLNSGLEHNITMPTTGEEAMKRLLACKGKDPYSILGVRPDCTDDDIKRYYKRQAFLVHPDKNPQPGAEEAFKILVHAFDIIGEPERRQSYDRKVAESHQVEQAWSELNDLLSQLHQKMEYAANTIRCTNCTKRHRRISVDRPCYAARMCSQCKIHHSAKEGDIWAEASYFGFLWHYYACMDGAVYDITEWAGCQRKNLKHLRPNSHNVQYRIVLGKQGGQPGGGGPGGGSAHGRRHKSGGGSASEREADLENFLNNLYSQSDMSATAGTGATPPHTETGGANAARSRRKNKRKKFRRRGFNLKPRIKNHAMLKRMLTCPL